MRNPIANPITISFDGKDVACARGEPVAAALVGAGKLALARSPKFHRPRGPACFRAACDGCLARVNDVPNVMTCMVPAEPGLRVVTQNTLGSRETDFLRMTDWFFPEGMNHHELFAGVPGVQRVMQVFARRVAGLGKLPKEGTPPVKAVRRELDAVVVGAGPAGMAVATELARRGRKVEVIEDGIASGGGVSALMGEDAKPWSGVSRAFAQAVAARTVTLRCETTAAGFYGDDLLVVGSDVAAEVITAKACVLATGAHDGVLAFEGNDLPGVMSARAAGFLLSRGIAVGERVVVAVIDGGGPFGEAYVRAMADSGLGCEVTLVREAPTRARGSSRVKDVEVSGESIKASALLIDAPRAPAYELCAQAGAGLAHEARGFVARAAKGKIAERVWAVGEVVGTPFEARAIAKEAAAVAAAIAP